MTVFGLDRCAGERRDFITWSKWVVDEQLKRSLWFYHFQLITHQNTAFSRSPHEEVPSAGRPTRQIAQLRLSLLINRQGLKLLCFSSEPARIKNKSCASRVTANESRAFIYKLHHTSWNATRERLTPRRTVTQARSSFLFFAPNCQQFAEHKQ